MSAIKKSEDFVMAYPQKADPKKETWVIAFDVNLDKLYEYYRNPDNSNMLNGKSPDVYVRDLRAYMFDEIYKVLLGFGFCNRLQNTLVFNNLPDATMAYKAVSRGLAFSWVKYFIDRIHLFKVDPNSDASDLLNKEQLVRYDERPVWFNDDLFHFLSQSYIETSEEAYNLFNNRNDDV